jgi:hypothetical protein
MASPIVRNHRFQDLTGHVFGRLTVLQLDGTSGKRTLWRCICVCSKEITARGDCLKSGNTRSCGCLHRDYTASGAARKSHGKAGTREYRIWLGMRARCENQNNAEWKNYGGRGIKVCERWQSFENFLADMGLRPSARHTLERRNNSGHYEPGNVVWATMKEQTRNTRANVVLTLNGISHTMVEWSEITGIKSHTISARLRTLGWGVERALTEAVKT